ncbi:MAG TPA: DUF6263 family protein [Ohtaekwangia sp.]
MKLQYLLVFALVFSVAFSPLKKSPKLEYTYKVGDQYDMNQVSKQNIKQDIPGMGEITVDVNIEGSMSFKVVEVTSTGGKIETAYTSLKMITKSPQGEMIMDSQGADDNIQNKVIKALLNKPFLVFMNKFGKVEKVENLENLYSGFSSLGVDEATTAQMTQSMKQSFGENTIKTSLEMALPNYPEKAAEVGGKWNNTTENAIAFPIKTENVWTFVKVDDQGAHLESDGAISTPDKEKVTTLNGMKAKTDLSGRQMTKAKVDLKTGWPTEISVLSEISGDLTLLAGGPIPEDMKVPMSISTESSFKIVKK